MASPYSPKAIALRSMMYATRYDGYVFCWGGGPSLPHDEKEENRARTLAQHRQYAREVGALCGITCNCLACSLDKSRLEHSETE
jgi:hypothetical protein